MPCLKRFKVKGIEVKLYQKSYTLDGLLYYLARPVDVKKDEKAIKDIINHVYEKAQNDLKKDIKEFFSFLGIKTKI